MDKTTVLGFFHNPPESPAEQFNKAFEHYRQSPGKNTNTERTLNSGGFTPYNLETVLYELQRLHGISDIEKIAPVPEETLLDIEILKDALAQDGVQNGNVANELKQVPASPDTPPATNPDPIKFREEYPFLNDPDCPNELKILVADKLTAYKQFQDAHAKLQELEAGTIVLTDAEKLALAATATNAFARSEQIKTELDHYRDNKEILGEDPIFRKLAMEREVEAMTNEECLKFINSTKSFVSRKNKSLSEAVSEDKKAELRGELDARNEKLALVNKKLGTGGGK